MASTFGKISGSIGLSLSIKGPGLTNSISGIAASWFESLPLIHLSESHNFGASHSISHKRLNQRKLISEISKGSFFLNDSESDFDKIATISKYEVPGPVLIELSNKSKKNKFKKQINCQDDKNLSSVKAIINSSKKPIIILGSLATRMTSKFLFNNLEFPIFTTVSAKGYIDEKNYNSAGIYSGVGLKLTPEHKIIPNADLVITVGLSAKEVLKVKKFNCKSINFELVETLGINGFNFDYRINLKYLDECINLLKNKNWGLQELEKTFSTLDSKLYDNFLPGSVFKLFNSIFSKEPRVVFDTGYFCTIAEHAWRSSNELNCLLSSNGRYMGTSIPMALGASLADKTKPVIVFMGDGGIGMYLSEIKLAVDHNLPILFVLLSDGGFGSIRTRAIKDNMTQKPLLFQNNRWIEVFHGYGIDGTQCNSLASLSSTVNSWKKTFSPFFIKINFNSEKYQTMIENIR